MVRAVRYRLAPPPGGTSVERTPSWVSCCTRRVLRPISWAMAVVLAHSGTWVRTSGGGAAVDFALPAICTTSFRGVDFAFSRAFHPHKWG